MRRQVSFPGKATATARSRSSRLIEERPLKLFRDSADLHHWTAYLPETGWFCFPATANGWDDRRPATTLDPVHLQEVPLWLAFNTGLLESDRHRVARKIA